MKKLIIDAGHGWETAGKRSIFHKNKYGQARIKENNANEAVANKLSFALRGQSVFITPEWWDVSLKERVQIENKIYRPGDDFISLHCDAIEQKDAALGGRFYYYSESGKKAAEHYTHYLKYGGYPIHLRPVKQANFYVLKYTKSRSVLFEMGFMTSESDLVYLESDDFRNLTTQLLKEAYLSL